MLSIDYWIDCPEDPFEMFATQSATRSLGVLVGQREQRRFDRSGWWGVSPKYYTVEDEHDIEVVEHLIGSAFVLAQATITQAVSIIKRMREDAGSPGWIPRDKWEIMNTAAPPHAETGQSKITIVNVAADYYKHHYEWKDEEWAGPTCKNRTIATAAAIGLGPSGYHNLEHALSELQIYPDNLVPLAQLVVTWREELADHIRAEGKKHGISIRPRHREDHTPESSG
jgi:hypothetical protein